MAYLKISNVDLELLEEQRLTLATITQNVALTKEQLDAINGIQNMLDDWSDQRAFSKDDFHDVYTSLNS